MPKGLSVLRVVTGARAGTTLRGGIVRRILVSLILVGIFLEVSGLIFSGSHDKPNDAMVSLLEPPQHQIQNLKHNSYFLLLGFAASPNVDPIQIGLQIWLESELNPSRRPFEYAKESRRDLRISPDVLERFREQSGPVTMQRVRQDAVTVRRMVTHASILADRYEQWLSMSFEDRGYGHVGVPRFAEMFLAHRLYLGEGFARGTEQGLRRVEQELMIWRAILAESRTLPMKTMAAAIVSEDTELLSDLLSQPRTSRFSVIRAGLLGRPLTAEERSLRWPVRNEFVVGKDRAEQSLSTEIARKPSEAARHAAWVATAARMQEDAFRKVQRPLMSSLFGFDFSNQRTLNLYAKYYQAVINASDISHGPLPTLKSIERSTGRTLTDTLFSPVYEEPGWDLFVARVLETDARLRLVGLQSALRKAGSVKDVHARIARRGTAYYDPFTGLPLMWNRKQGTMYSVGADGLDDGGDPTFDIVVTVPLNGLKKT